MLSEKKYCFIMQTYCFIISFSNYLVLEFYNTDFHLDCSYAFADVEILA